MSLRTFNPFASTNTRGSAPAPSGANTTSAYSSTETRVTGARDQSERMRSWSPSLSRSSSLGPPDFDTLSDEAYSSFLDTVSMRRASVDATKPAVPRYIYYRIYAQDGAIPSVNPVYSDDPYLGHMLAKLVTPPHTVMNIKRCLAAFEKVNDNIPTDLFISASSQAPMDNAGHVPMFAYSGPGCTPSEPMALAAMFSSAERGQLDAMELAASLLPSPERPVAPEARYLYYQVYKGHCAVLSKQPASSNDPYVGYIRADSVPPPHTTASIMRCISKGEGLDNSKQSQLFANISSRLPMGEGYVSILTNNHAGSTPEDPMAYVELPTPAIVQPPTSEHLPNPVVPTPYSTFSKRMRATISLYPGSQNPDWLTIKKNEILRLTHDPAQLKKWVYPDRGVSQRFAHSAISAKGRMGYVDATNIKPY